MKLHLKSYLTPGRMKAQGRSYLTPRGMDLNGGVTWEVRASTEELPDKWQDVDSNELPDTREDGFSLFIFQGRAGKQSPTIINYTAHFPAFGEISGVSISAVQ